MKNSLIVLVTLIFSLATNAQISTSYIDFEKRALEIDKKAIVKESIVLTNEDAAVFWPLYDEYNTKMLALNEEYISLLEQYSNKHDKLSFSEAMNLWEDMMDIKDDLLKLERKYYKKMINKMSPVKVVTYFDVEREVRARVDAELLKGMPEFATNIRD